MEGKVIGISGSVVIVAGLEDPKMNNIVFVGDKNLVGEIVKIEGHNAIIQVYEDTSGLKVGEKATDSREPLSVELGPGLIGSIFDGIQRPLDKILNKEGTFMGSGIKVDSIDRERKWHFKPKVEAGKEVFPGEELGEVKETSLIKHKVLVPANKKGVIKSIVDEGEYTVEDVIAVLEHENKKEEIKLMTKWPVRMPRPVKEKLAPNIPLLTGQRVIDTMFPVAMGGTSAVPGPFGSGKCVAGDTPILFENGSIMSIEEVYSESIKEGNILLKDGNETVVRLKTPLKLLSFYDNKIKKSESKLIYKGKSDSLVKIKTRSGKEVKVTPTHKLFKFENSGIVEKSSSTLKKGDYIASIRKFDVDSDCKKIDYYSILSDARTKDSSILMDIKKIIKTDSKKAKNSNLKEITLNSITRNNKNPALKLEWISAICTTFGVDKPKIKSAIGDRAGIAVSLPEKVSPEFAEFIGYYVSEGYIREGETIVFTNSDEKLRNRYTKLAKNLFNVECKIENYKNKTTNVIISSTILAKIIKRLINSTNASDKYIPHYIINSNDEVIAGFIRGYYLGDGSCYKGDVEFSTASKKLQLQLSYLLTRLGILHSLRTGKTSKKDRNRVFIRNIKELERVYNALTLNFNEKFEKIERIHTYITSKKTSYTSYDILPMESSEIETLYNKFGRYSELRQKGIEINNYTKAGEHLSVSSFRKLLETVSNAGINTATLQKMNTIEEITKYIYFDRVDEVEEISGPFDVYDVTTPEFGSNFVGGNGALLLHNTVIQHQLAKWSDADVIVYVGCGERGNEMTEILATFPELKDPKSGKPLMDRTILIANTSNMPVAAREASIYTGITLAEYYRDMGYSVAVMADSTSRWAEALRELSGRLEEMPGEEGYPAYLGRRVGEFYERAGRAKLLSGKIGATTLIGAVSPPGGDISEPVSQNTLRVTRVFWALDASLANARHFPSINWLNSYSLYKDELDGWYRKNIAEDWPELRDKALATLQKEADINEIVQLVGYDALPESDKLILDVARMLREDYLQQNAFDDVDTYASVKKQYKMLKLINKVFDYEKEALERNVTIQKIQEIPIKPKISRLRYIREEEIDSKINEIDKDLEEIKKLSGEK
jgi:V/A-type H+-transporting ATPase subunit A